MNLNQALIRLCLLLLSPAIIGQSNFYNSPVAYGKAGVGVTESNSWSSVLNPAGTVGLETTHLAVSYNLPYFVNELSSKSFTGILPFKYGVISASISQYGFSLYQENTFNVSYARSLTPKLDLAVQFNYMNTHVNQSGSGGQICSGVGIKYAALDNLHVGMYISNPEEATIEINDVKEEIPSLFVIGFSWIGSENFSIAAEAEKRSDIELIYKLGLEYNIKDRLWIRTGVLGKPTVYTMGLGFHVFSFHLDTGIAVHPVLGVSSCFGISYRFNRK